MPHLPVVQRVHALLAQQFVRAREVGVLERRTHGGRSAAGQIELGGVREVLEAGLVVGGLLLEGRVDGEPVAGDALGGLQHLAQRPGAPGVEDGVPGGGRAGGADAEAAGHGVREGDGLPVLQEEVLVRAQRGALAPVDGVHLAVFGVVVDEVSAAADAGRVGLGHTERRRGRHGRVPVSYTHL